MSEQTENWKLKSENDEDFQFSVLTFQFVRNVPRLW